ncbi:hypothetical protein ACFL2Q_09830 [Thermodesulfobacteriota bacterium]
MICLETIGYYSREPGSQSLPPPLGSMYDNDRRDFVAFVSNRRSHDFLMRVIGAFRKHAAFPSEGLAAPSIIPGLDLSDNWAFQQVGYKAVMVTDTAFMRYPYYHSMGDTPEKLDYLSLAKVTHGLARTVQDLAEG